MKRTLARSRLLMAGALLCCAAAHGQEKPAPSGAVVTLGVGAEYSDNAYKSDVFERSETKEYFALGLGYVRTSDSFESNILYNGEFANYEHNTTDEDKVIQGASKLTWHMLPGRLQWDASNDRSEQLQNTRTPDTRNNKKLRNIISTGPTFTARLGPVDDLILNGGYYRVSYDDSSSRGNPGAPPGGSAGTRSSDNDRLQGGVGWQHRLSKTDVLSLNYQQMESKFDDLSEEFTYKRVFGTYAVELRSGGYTVSLGANRSERDNASSSDGFLAHLGWRLATGGHRFGAIFINELTDSGIGLGGNSLVGSDYQPVDSNYDVIDVVERTNFSFDYGYDRLCERCIIDIGVKTDKQDFDVQPRDQESVGVNGSFGYRMTATLRASLHGGYSEIDYPQDASGKRTDKRTVGALVLDWKLSEKLSAAAWMNKDKRDSDVNGQGYDEWFGGMSFTYALR